MRHAAISIVMLLSAAAGCIPSYPVAHGELERYWMLTDVPAALPATAPAPAPVHPSGFRMPTKWTIRRQKSLVWSTVSIVRAMDSLKAGTDEVAFSVSPAHARALVDILAQARAALADLKEMVETADRSDRNRWANLLAQALVRVESLSRLVITEEGEPAGAGEGEPLGMAAEPMLRMIAQYLNERSDGSLLGDLSAGELKRLRDVLAEVVVRLGFEVAGKEPPPGLRKQLAERTRAATSTEELGASLSALLARHIHEAPPAAGGARKREAVLAALKWAPRALKLLESFLSQWDRMDRITVELVRSGPRRAVTVTIAVRPGQQVRIADVYVLMPTIVFRGATRIVVLPEANQARQTVVAFNPVGEGAVELRFEGLLYGLVKLLALPLASGPLREVRVSTGGGVEGEKLLNVAVLTQATGEGGDPRRMIVVQDARTRKILRQAFSVESVVEKSRTVVSYITPTRRYTYQRARQAAPR